MYDLEESALDAVCDDGGGMPVEDGGNGGRTRLTAVSGQVAANFELAGYAEDCPGASDARWLSNEIIPLPQFQGPADAIPLVKRRSLVIGCTSLCERQGDFFSGLHQRQSFASFYVTNLTMSSFRLRKPPIPSRGRLNESSQRNAISYGHTVPCKSKNLAS